MSDLLLHSPADPVPPTGADPLAWAHPVIREWFEERFTTPTEPQIFGWPHILARRATLISAPTGSGKTLAAFLTCIDGLVRKALTGALEDVTEVVYVSPLKALSNDIQKNLQGPLGEIFLKAGECGLLMPEIRVGLRTGDTLASERRAMLTRPPHILVTTPESLYILLTSDKSRANLRRVHTVIVDEIHAVADDKRGAHLALSLERLEALQSRPPVRIGLSATQKPIELVAGFLTGSGRPLPEIIDVGHKRQLDLAIEVPGGELGAAASNEMWGDMYDRIAALVSEHRSTLVFVNTRRLSERVAHHLGERLGTDAVAAHHGSLSRKIRLAAERKLKAGEIRVLIATASLELGIDIGFVDLVCQIGSTRSIAVALQRIGRAGHWRGAIPKGRIFATTRDELLECAALMRALRRGELDRLAIPPAPLDVLAQQIVAACAAANSSDGWSTGDLFDLVRRAGPYRDLPREDFDAIVAMLSEGISAKRGRYGSYLFHDQVNGRLRARRGARLAAITSGGAIPETALYAVVATPEDTPVGTVDEDFAVESLAGDIMLLGNTSWRIRRVERSRVVVEDAQGAPPNIPFWRGEAPPRTAELSEQLSELRVRIGESLGPPNGIVASAENRAATIAWLKEDCCLDQSGAEQAVDYILQGRAVLNVIPSQKLVVAERFFDESGGMQLILHAPFGAAINKAWGLSLRKRFCRSFNFELQAAATDNGLNISLSDQHSFPLADVFQFLHANSVQPVLEQAVLAAPVFQVRWRWAAGRALALLRFQGGKKVPPQIQRMRSEDLLAAVFPQALACLENIVGDIPIPDHPLVRETMKDVLGEALDLEGLKRVLAGLGDGSIATLAVDTTTPSAFCHEILNANPYAYLDDAPLEERRARAVEMRRVLPEALASEIGRLDPGAIDEVRKDAWPDVRDADELHDALFTLVALPEPASASADSSPLAARIAESLPGWRLHFGALAAQNRVARATREGRAYWVCAERAPLFTQIFSGNEGAATLRWEMHLPEVGEADASREDALTALAAGWMSHAGPTTANELAELLGLPAAEIDKGLLALEARGAILRGQFTDRAPAAKPSGRDTILEPEWCERRLLARIHRLTLGGLRKQIQPVAPAQFMRWLLRWQHVAPATQLAGERGLLETIRQLQGFEAPANAWERQIFRRRVAAYTPEMLDQLCLTGAVGWGRLSPHPATRERATADRRADRRRVIPTSVAPIAFFVREDSDWMSNFREATHEAHAAANVEAIDERNLSPAAREVHAFLQQRGASFFADIVRATGRVKAEVETALWELVSAGLLTADGFDNLRALIDPRRRAGQGAGRNARPRHSTGRWSLLSAGIGQGSPADRGKSVEAVCGVLLRRYGVVFREVLCRESLLPPWREVLQTLRRMEDRGDVRGGRFVSDFLGEQFALPVAVESLRAMRREAAPGHPPGERVTLSAADPLNLAGIIVPGERVAANSGGLVAFHDGAVSAEEVRQEDVVEFPAAL